MNKFIFALLLLLHYSIYSQEKFELKSIGFSINAPEKWYKVENKEILDNLNYYDFSEEQKKELLSSNNSAIELVTYSKYKPSEYKGIIPTIKIRTRNVKSKSILDFLKVIENSNSNLSNQLNNFEYKEKPEKIIISNKEIIRFVARFSLSNNNTEYQIINYSYYILKNGYYISINFIEEYNKENNTTLFEEIANSISLTE
ncbi:hypothetical protein [Flavobacterium sp.]|uniref:hypothetical protein n=1 Tax=Flavobacterium sp. TaxID=239 RepID=UPI004048B075